MCMGHARDDLCPVAALMVYLAVGYAVGSAVEGWAATNMGGHCQPCPSSSTRAGPGKQSLCRSQF